MIKVAQCLSVVLTTIGTVILAMSMSSTAVADVPASVTTPGCAGCYKVDSSCVSCTATYSGYSCYGDSACTTGCGSCTCQGSANSASCQ
jgi:hypothetical protein